MQRTSRPLAVRQPASPPAAPQEPSAGRAGERGLDGFVFLVSNLQTGFGPFVNAYLTQQRWTQADIGLVMTVSSLVGLLAQVPGGWLVDRARSKRLVAALSVAAIALSALALGLWAGFAAALGAMVVHAVASCTLTPAISTLSLALVGHARAGGRFGRNASFASIGGAVAALAMGACGYYLSDASVFFVTAALGIPALFALSTMRERAGTQASAPHPVPAIQPPGRLADLLRNRALLAFGGCVTLFHLANAAMLPLAGSALTLRSSQSSSPLIAACIVVPQLVVVLGAPLVGHAAQRYGRRPFLILCFGALAARGVLFANAEAPWAFVAVQLLDGVSAAVLGVMMPLVIADATRGTGHFNLAYGAVATGMGLGAAVATTLWGYVADREGMAAAFLGMAVVAAVAAVFTAFAMPETRPGSERAAVPDKSAPSPTSGLRRRLPRRAAHLLRRA